MMRRCLAVAPAAACSHPASHESTTPASSGDDPSCPMIVPGASVAVEHGARVVFSVAM